MTEQGRDGGIPLAPRPGQGWQRRGGGPPPALVLRLARRYSSGPCRLCGGIHFRSLADATCKERYSHYSARVSGIKHTASTRQRCQRRSESSCGPEPRHGPVTAVRPAPHPSHLLIPARGPRGEKATCCAGPPAPVACAAAGQAIQQQQQQQKAAKSHVLRGWDLLPLRAGARIQWVSHGARLGVLWPARRCSSGLCRLASRSESRPTGGLGPASTAGEEPAARPTQL